MSVWSLVAITASIVAQPSPRVTKPAALQRDDIVALVAPAGPVDERLYSSVAEVLAGLGLRARSFIVEPRIGYLSAKDDTRASALNRAIRDPSVRAILCMRGGYGTPRILDRIDYTSLRRDPKIIIGYSDITALLIAIHRRTGLVTFHGPMGQDLVTNSRGPLSKFTRTHFREAFTVASPFFADWGNAKSERTLVEGVAEGRLMGGNLSMITATLGTPYEIDTRDTILFIEDVNEKSFRIDRMLAQLRLAGKLDTVRGVILGSFVNCGLESQRVAIPLNTVFRDYLRPLGVPVLEGYPAGHGLRDHATLPFGVRVRLDASSGTLTILEDAVDSR